MIIYQKAIIDFHPVAFICQKFRVPLCQALGNGDFFSLFLIAQASGEFRLVRDILFSVFHHALQLSGDLIDIFSQFGAFVGTSGTALALHGLKVHIQSNAGVLIQIQRRCHLIICDIRENLPYFPDRFSVYINIHPDFLLEGGSYSDLDICFGIQLDIYQHRNLQCQMHAADISVKMFQCCTEIGSDRSQADCHDRFAGSRSSRFSRISFWNQAVTFRQTLWCDIPDQSIFFFCFVTLIFVCIFHGNICAKFFLQRGFQLFKGICSDRRSTDPIRHILCESALHRLNLNLFFQVLPVCFF